MLADARVPLFQLGQKLVAEAVAGVGRIAVGDIFAPALSEAGEISLDLGSRGSEHGAKNAAFGKIDGWMDAGEAFGPRAAQEFSQDRFRLVVEGVGGGYGVKLMSDHELAKPGV